MSLMRQVNLLDSRGNIVAPNFPLPTDGDSIYSKDISSASSIGTFTGNILSLFDDYSTAISDVSATNPKTFTVQLERPIKSNKIAIGSSSGDFSNVKISLLDLAGTVRATIDDSGNSTKYTSNVYQVEDNAFITIVLEFHTADPVSINGLFVPKGQSRSISSIDGFISDGNSSGTPLLAGATFTGTQIDTLNYGMIMVSVFSDVASATDGLITQFRSTATGTWRTSDSYTISAGVEKVFSFQPVRRYMRVLYTNGAVNQTVFDFQTVMKPVYVKPSSHRIADAISGQDDAELMKSCITGSRPDGTFANCDLDYGNNLRVNSYPYTYSIAEGDIPMHYPLLKFGTRTLVAANTKSTVWEGNTALYAYLTTAEQLKVSSSSANDTALGTGARTVTLIGLDANWLEISETITMNGVAAVTTAASFIRIYRAYVETCGTGLTNAGLITITNNAGTVQQCVITAGDGQSLMAVWTVPAGKVAYMVGGTTSTDSNKGMTASFVVRLNDGGVLYPWLIKYRAYIFSGNERFPFTIPFKIPAKTDIEVQVLTPAAAGTTSAGSTFELWYEDV